MKIYVASSWRNKGISLVVNALRNEGHKVYDFREADTKGAAFNWSDIDKQWQEWTPEEFSEMLWHPIADRGFNRDWNALRQADGLLLVLPCGRSAHLELGVAIGMQKPTAILLSDGEPELMYRAAGRVCVTLNAALSYFAEIASEHVYTFKGEDA